MSNVVIMNLLGALQAGRAGMRFISIRESEWWHRCYFLVGWGGGVIARIPS
jgi:hypothetical protein